MALLIKNAKFKNTTVTAPDVYARIQFVAIADGKKVAVSLLTGLDKESALAYNSVSINIPEGMTLTLNENQNQDLATVHELVKTELEKEGLEVTIDLA